MYVVFQPLITQLLQTLNLLKSMHMSVYKFAAKPSINSTDFQTVNQMNVDSRHMEIVKVFFLYSFDVTTTTTFAYAQMFVFSSFYLIHILTFRIEFHAFFYAAVYRSFLIE